MGIGVVILLYGFAYTGRAASARIRPPSTTLRTIASRLFGIIGAFLWTSIGTLLGTLKLRNLSFLGSDQMDNLLKDHS